MKRSPQSEEHFTSSDVQHSLWSFVALFLVLVVLHQWNGIIAYPHDSLTYWSLADPSRLFDFPDVMRGYVYPALLMPLHAISNAIGESSKLPFRLGTSLVYAYALTGPVADFFLRCFGGTLSFARRLVFGLLPIAVFPGLFLYPLSDAPAALLMIVACLLAWRATGRYWWVTLLFSGMAVGAAYNIRTLYLFAAIVFLIACPFLYFRTQSWSRRATGVLLVVLGGFLVAMPQIPINKRHHARATPLVIATVNGKQLMPVQLYWGVGTQRYETTLRKDAPAASQFYKDPAGLALSDLYGGSLGEPSIKGYFRLVMLHPVQFLGIYGRHFVNGMDVRDGMVYTNDESADKNASSLLCLTLCYIGCLIIVGRGGLRWREFFCLSPILIVVLAVIPGAVETRFFLPLYLILFGLIATQFDYNELKNYISKNKIAVAIGYLAMCSLSLAITTASMVELQYVLP